MADEFERAAEVAREWLRPLYLEAWKAVGKPSGDRRHFLARVVRKVASADAYCTPEAVAERRERIEAWVRANPALAVAGLCPPLHHVKPYRE
ncbi:hypothetical protein [Candidatus Poriferisodalis sp.]|uniref:hypothetical protein n=1 Tax=Candidatus Poriferisodalis sp. TaxID=3101277 RepID=UPI003B026F96